jgi:uncharacterized membrane protein (DUF485 family)
MSSAPAPQHSAALLAQSPEYRQLLASKRRFIIPATCFFVVYYFSLLVLVGWFPKAMSARVFGLLNWAYVFAVSQFFMAWGMAFLYVRKASEWDRQSALLVGRFAAPAGSPGESGAAGPAGR